MQLHYIEFRNIGPYGNKLECLEFTNQGLLWQCTGKNGVGKSHVFSLPKLLFYGKMDNISKGDIANRMNLHGYICGVVEIAPTILIKIERGFSPSFLNVYKSIDDGETFEDISKAGINNMQDYIDQEVTSLPYHIFSNVVSLNVGNFKSFVTMSPNDKRIIIDKLFAMDVINKMNTLVKADLRDIKLNMDLFDREIISLKTNIDHAVKELEKLKNKVTKNNTERISEIVTQLTKYKPKLEEGYKKQKEYTNKKNEISKSYNIFIQQRSQINYQLSHLRDQVNLYNQDMCPTCSTPFTESRFDLIKGQLNENIKAKENELEELNANETKYTNALNKLNEGIAKINEFVIQINSAYRTLESELNKLKADKPVEFESIKNIISSNTENLKTKENDKVKFNDDYKYIAILEQLYSDAGVKKKILESYLPTLNKEIEYTLNELHFPYTLTFNSDFDAALNYLGMDISVESLSTGEKKSCDLAVLISIMRMLKRKYPTLNIFMLDEVLSSLDSDKIYDVIGILKNTAKDLNMNIFIINHSLLPNEFFDVCIEIEKNDGFSDIKVQNLNI
jgi:DNA repair exonuclease SbcCD ATPase subunit